MPVRSFSRGLVTPSLMALLATLGAACQSPDTDCVPEAGDAEDPTAEGSSALRTPGALAKYFHVSTSQAITEELAYTTWSARYHTILRGRVENELFFYDRIDGTAKVFTVASDGTLTFKYTQTVPTGVDIWVRGNFAGGTGKDLASYQRETGLVTVYEILSTGQLQVKFTQYVASGYTLAFAGFYSGTFDDLVFYDRGTGAAKFYASSGLTLGLAFSDTWQKIWDYVVPGRFNTDGITDVLFYNQDGGDAKIQTFNSGRDGTTTWETTSWPITPYATVTVGEFGGSSSTDDVLLYDPRDYVPDNVTDPIDDAGASGKGRFFLASTSGVLSAGAVHGTWQKKWTHVLSVKQTGSTTDDLLFYSNAYDVAIVPVLLADNGGQNRAQVTAAQLDRYIAMANDVYRGAGIRFVWDGNFELINSTDLNAYPCGNSTPEWLKDVADDVAGWVGAPAKLVFYFRTQGGGDGCGSTERQYVMLPDDTVAGTADFDFRDGGAGSLNGNMKLFPHEAGHFFTMDHTAWDSDWGLPTSYADMDTDRNTSPWAAIYDTSPTPHGSYWDGGDPNCDGMGEICNGALEARCDDSPSGVISYPLSGGGTLSLNPDRHNVMLKGHHCDYTYNFTAGQNDAIRDALFGCRVALTN